MKYLICLPKVAILAALLAIPAPAIAQRVISVDTVQDGGNLDVPLNGSLFIGHPGNNPLLTLTGSARASGIGAIDVGDGPFFPDGSFPDAVISPGQLLVTDNSSLSAIGLTVGPNSFFTINNQGRGDMNSVIVGQEDIFFGLGEATGVASVSGSGSEWRTNIVEISGNGSEVRVLDGGYLSTLFGSTVRSGTSAVVSGAGALWDVGRLDIQEGAQLTSSNGGHVSAFTLTTPLESLQGDGTISVKGLVLGGYDLRFDSTHGPQQTIRFGQNDLGRLRLSLDNSNGVLGVGESGTLTITDDVRVESSRGILEGDSVSEVTGSLSRWFARGPVLVRNSAQFNITSGGEVISHSSGATSRIEADAHVMVDGTGSRWRTNGFPLDIPLDNSLEIQGLLTVSNGGEVSTNTLVVASLGNLLGDGTIVTNGLSLSGYDLVFDRNHGLQQTISFGDGGQIHLDLDGAGSLGTGIGGEMGTITIADGVKVASQSGSIGELAGAGESRGEVTVRGIDSTWEVAQELKVGHFGRQYHGSLGTLNILDGATVSVGTYLSVEEAGSLVGKEATVKGDVFYEGILGESNSTGSLTIIGNLSHGNRFGFTGDEGGIVRFAIADLADFSRLIVSGDWSAGGSIEVYLLEDFAPQLGDEFNLADFTTFTDAGYRFDFSLASLGHDQWTWDTSSFAIDGTVRIGVIPEPSTAVLVTAALVGILTSIRYRPNLRPSVLLVAGLLVLGAGGPRVANAVPIVDQISEYPSSSPPQRFAASVRAVLDRAQVITPGISGTLTKLDIPVTRRSELVTGHPLVLEIQTVENSMPSSVGEADVLASITLEAASVPIQMGVSGTQPPVSFDLSGANIQVRVGEPFAFVLSSSLPDIDSGRESYLALGATGIYEGGDAYSRFGSTGEWRVSTEFQTSLTQQQAFTTYVDPVPEPSTTSVVILATLGYYLRRKR